MTLLRRVVAMAVCLLTTSAAADKLDVRERYEETLLQKALAKEHLERDPNPDGKIIERIVIVANDVILKGDFPLSNKIPWTWANHLHVRTRDYVIRRELLFHVGERYQADLIAESARNLRAMFILAVARIAVARGSRPDRIVVLVMTKDNWTLRLNSDFSTDFAAGTARLDTLSLSISESNLAGRNKTVSVIYALDPGRHTVGLGYTDPRMNGSRHQLSVLADMFLPRNGGGPEGWYGSLLVGRPLFSLRTHWGWQLNLTYLQDIARYFQGGDLRGIKLSDGEVLPDYYAERVISGNLVGSRSWGVVDKATVSAGFRVTSALYTTPANFPTSMFTPGALAYYQKHMLPYSESASGPFLSALVWRASYVRLQNIDTFALSEDIRVGPTASVEIRFADPVFGFNSKFITFTGTYGATYYRHDDLFAISMSGSARVEGGVIAGTEWVNQSITASFRNVTPKFGPFRLHVAGAVQVRRNDLANTQLTLGADNGLRGYPDREFVGNNFYRANIELRSIAANLWTIHVGGVLFYDGGDAPATLAVASWHQDLGFGLRILFPQFNRDCLRLDLGFPLERPSSGGYTPRFTASFGQAF